MKQISVKYSNINECYYTSKSMQPTTSSIANGKRLKGEPKPLILSLRFPKINTELFWGLSWWEWFLLVWQSTHAQYTGVTEWFKHVSHIISAAPNPPGSLYMMQSSVLKCSINAYLIAVNTCNYTKPWGDSIINGDTA